MRASTIAAITLLVLPCLEVCRAQTAGDYNQIGLTNYNNARFIEAATSFEQALKLDSSNATFKSNLVAACRSLAAQQAAKGEFGEALNTERRAFTLDGSNTTVREELAAYCNNYGAQIARTGTVTIARALLSEAMQLAPGHKVFVTNLCALLIRESTELQSIGNDRQAGLLLSDAERMDPDSFVVQVAIGELNYRQNNYTSSLQHFDLASHFNPNDTNITTRLEQIRKESSIEGGFKNNDRSRFIIRYEDGVQNLSWDISGILDEAYREIGHKLQCWPTAPLTVIIYSAKQFKAITAAPDWTVGRFDGKIRICVSDLTAGKDILKRVVCHEYTHAVVFNLYGASVPVWINEGLAQYASSERSLTVNDKALLQSVAGGNLPPPWNLDRSFHSINPQEIALAYVETRLFITYLFGRYGDNVSRQFVRECSREPSLETVLKDLFNMTTDQIYSEWMADLKKQMTP